MDDNSSEMKIIVNQNSCEPKKKKNLGTKKNGEPKISANLNIIMNQKIKFG